MQIGGVEIKPLNRGMLFGRLEVILTAGQAEFHHVVTVNPEFIVEAQTNGDFKEVLNAAEFTLVDGVGLLGALHFRNLQLERNDIWYRLVQFAVSCIDVGLLRQEMAVEGVEVERITGVDFVQELVRKEWMSGKRVFLLGGKDKVAEKAADRLKGLAPQVEFGYASGYRDVRNAVEKMNNSVVGDDVVDQIREFGPDVLLVAYGHPWQDLLIERIKGELPTVRLAVGVGGTFDYLARNVVRAPGWMQELGLEWLYRLIVQPQRYKRIVNATWRFARLVAHEKVVR